MVRSTTEKRAHERAQFFLINDGREFMPVWVFRPAGDEAALACLVIDLSPGGVQVISEKHDIEPGQHCRLTFLSDDQGSLPGVEARLVWSRADKGLHAYSGLEFTGMTGDTVDRLIDSLRDGSARYLRCSLRPIGTRPE
ncbi:MAG TPA: PilZ domain-containing protein [Noviherbaspirillum sp.]